MGSAGFIFSFSFLLAYLFRLHQLGDSSGMPARPRKKVNPVDYVYSLYGTDYAKAVLQSLVHHLGLQKSLILLKECANIQGQEKADFFHSRDAVLPGMRRLFANASILRDRTLMLYPDEAGAEQFYRNCSNSLKGYYVHNNADVNQETTANVQERGHTKHEVEVFIFGTQLTICYWLCSINC